jgi:hypothetical protein
MEVYRHVALADAAHVGAVGLVVGSAIRFLTMQKARLRGDAHDDVPKEATMHARLATALIPTVPRRSTVPDGEGGDKNLEPM